MLVRWFQNKVKAAIKRRLMANLDEAGAYLVRKIRARIGTQGPPRSSPGESPHADTDALWRSYTYEVDPVTEVLKVYSPLPYAMALEYGTSKMVERPYLRPVLSENESTVARIIATGYSVDLDSQSAGSQAPPGGA